MAASPSDYVRALRAPFFTASVLPVCLGMALAWYDGYSFDLVRALLTVVGIVFIHAGGNLANDYYDYLYGIDEANVNYVRGLSGGSRLIQEGRVSAGWYIKASLFCFAVGSIIGLYLVYVTGLVILVLGVFGVVTAFLYSAAPLRFSHRGVGEFIVALDFGLLPVVGAYVVQSGGISPRPALASIPIACLIANILIVNGLPDAPSDADTGKRTLVVRTGRLAAVHVVGLLYSITFGGIVVLVLSGIFPKTALIALLGAPIAAFVYVRAMKAVSEGGSNQHLKPACVAGVLTHLLAGLLLIAGVAIG